MDVLMPTTTTRRWLGAAALCAWLVAAACLSLTGGSRREPSFPHRVHVVDNQLACTFCHGTVRAAETPGMPPPELCAPCHDQFDKDKPADRRVTAFFGPDSRYRTVADASLDAEIVFSHRQHVTDGKLDCEACHGDVQHQDEVPLAPLATKAACMECHARSGTANTCSTCHRTIGTDWRPPTHDPDWQRDHGATARCPGDEPVDRCELCHQDATSCQACHQHVAPEDHDQTFRLRSHGAKASFDRSRCATCHTQDSCEQCHQETRPRSHRGGYGAPGQRHCTSCHLPLQDNDCATCHRSNPGHLSAAPLPPGHVPAMNCRMCHGNGQPLPHPDGGHACTACHR